MRQETGAMICPSCRKLISVDEERCPYCGAMRPGLWGYGPVLQRLFGQQLDPVLVILASCVLLYIIALAIDLPGAMQRQGLFNLLSPSSVALYRLGMTGGYAGGHWWTLLTAIYLHGSLLHIFFNMMWIRQLGSETRQVFGPARFFLIFTFSGAAGFALSNLWSAHPSIGASGAIFGFLGAMLAYGRKRGGSMGTMVSRQMLQWAVILFLFGFMIPGINNLAHLGGFAAGFVMGQRLPSEDEKREGRGTQLLALGLLGLTVLGFVLSIARFSALLR